MVISVRLMNVQFSNGYLMFMSPISPVFHTVVTVSIGLKTYLSPIMAGGLSIKKAESYYNSE